MDLFGPPLQLVLVDTIRMRSDARLLEPRRIGILDETAAVEREHADRRQGGDGAEVEGEVGMLAL